MGHLQRARPGLELLEQFQAGDRFRQQQRCVFGRSRHQPGASVYQRRHVLPLRREVPPRLDVLAIPIREDRPAAPAGLEEDARIRDGLHHQRDRQAGFERFETHPWPGIRRDFGDGVHGTRGALHADLADEPRHRLEKPRLALQRNHQPLGRNDVEQAPMLGGEATHLVAVVRHPRHAVFVLAVPAVRFENHDRTTAVAFVDAQLGVAAHDVHRLAGGVEDVRMTGQGEHPALAEHVFLVAPVALHRDRRRGRQVLFAQEVHGLGLGGESFQGHAAALAPASGVGLALFARTELDAAFHLHDVPGETPAAFGVARPLLVLLAARIVGELLQGPQRALPDRDGGRQVGECPGTERRVTRGRIRATVSVATQFRDPAQDRRALGREPGVAIALRTLVEHPHQRLPLVETVLVVAADPAVAEAVAEDFEVWPVDTAGVERPSGLRAQRIDHECGLVVQRAGMPFRRAQQLGQ